MTTSDPSSHGTPVYMTVWSLLPPSFLSNAAFNLGCGILHTNVYLPDINTEFAFGGHDVPGVTGIFSLPRDGPRYEDGISHLGPYKIPAPGPPPIADCHYVGAWFLGYAGPPDVGAASASISDQAGASGAPWSETGRWAAPQRGWNAFREPGHFETFDASPSTNSGALGQLAQGTLGKIGNWFGGATTESPASTSSPAASHSVLAGLKEEGQAAATSNALDRDVQEVKTAQQRHPRHSGARARSIAFAMRTIQELKSTPDFHGTSYDLLHRNCNHFSSLLCSRLVGCDLPGFVNRAAGLGAKVAPYLPPGVLEMDTEIVEEEGEQEEEDGRWKSERSEAGQGAK